MKAKEYAEKFNQNKSMTNFVEICNSFMQECKDLLILRHAQTDFAAIAVFKEQDKKWQAFCRLVEGVKPEGFRMMVQEQYPVIYEVMKNRW